METERKFHMIPMPCSFSPAILPRITMVGVEGGGIFGGFEFPNLNNSSSVSAKCFHLSTGQYQAPANINIISVITFACSKSNSLYIIIWTVPRLVPSYLDT